MSGARVVEKLQSLAFDFRSQNDMRVSVEVPADTAFAFLYAHYAKHEDYASRAMVLESTGRVSIGNFTIAIEDWRGGQQ